MKFLVCVISLIVAVKATVRDGDIALVYSGIGNLVPSSTYNPSYDHSRLRLHFDQNREGGATWHTASTDLNNWMEIGTQKVLRWTTITTQGRGDQDDWVTSYSIDYTQDGLEWFPYDNARFFQGNYDRESLVTHHLDPPIEARSIRVRPWRSYNDMAMRMEAYARTLSSTIPDVIPEPIGAIESGAHLACSSEYDVEYTVMKLRLNFDQFRVGSGSWMAATNDENQWVQVSTRDSVEWVKISTQGRRDADQWIESYQIKYTNDGINWFFVEDGKLFEGNSDRNTIVTHEFDTPFLARTIRVMPVTWKGHISMRMEAYYTDTS